GRTRGPGREGGGSDRNRVERRHDRDRLEPYGRHRQSVPGFGVTRPPPRRGSARAHRGTGAGMTSFPRHKTVSDVMTRSVHVASPLTPFKLLVRLIEENPISGVPIVDQQGMPVGIVSESDLLLKERRAELESSH